MSEFIVREHLAGSQGAVQSPIISRTMQWMGNGMANYAQARKIMFIPFPFPHAQLSAFFVWVVVMAIPLVLAHYTLDSWLGGVLTFLSVTCLVGLHEGEYQNESNGCPRCLRLVYAFLLPCLINIASTLMLVYLTSILRSLSSPHTLNIQWLASWKTHFATFPATFQSVHYRHK